MNRPENGRTVFLNLLDGEFADWRRGAQLDANLK
jgi:hypothetical protein